MTDRLEEIRKRCNAATPGPWNKVIWVDKTTVESSIDETICWTELCYNESAKDESDLSADFIAASREDIPYLLGVIAKLKMCNCGKSTEKDNTGPCPGLQCEEIAELRDQLKQYKKALSLTCDSMVFSKQDYACKPQYWLDKAKEVQSNGD